jgi:phosphate transport system protein
MEEQLTDISLIDQRVGNLFFLVSEALAGATQALLSRERATGQTIIDADQAIDDLTQELDRVVWAQIDAMSPTGNELRYLIGVLLILPELERSADLAEHIAQRAVSNLGSEMSAVSRGIVQRMAEVASEMWAMTLAAFAERSAQGLVLTAADEELDVLRDRLMNEAGTGPMAAAVAAQVTLLARFYERIGDHAVNLARRIESIFEVDS